jgi:hypothetical protein
MQHVNECQDTGLWPTECKYGCLAICGETCIHGYEALVHDDSEFCGEEEDQNESA